MNKCVMSYRPGTFGLTGLAFPNSDPHWRCSCGGWRLGAVAMPLRVAGNNLIEAQRSWAAHAADRRGRADDVGP